MGRSNQQDVGSAPQRWWLEAGTESCTFCAARYHVEAAYYCAECDRPVCPACVVEIFMTRHVVCPACGAGG